MSKVEPVFAEFNQHIALLVNQAGGNMQPEAVSTQQSSASVPVTFAVPQSSPATVEKTDLTTNVSKPSNANITKNVAAI
jgi:hypothetical protein